MLTKVKKVWDIITTVIVAIIGILAVAYIGLMIFGLRGYTVLSGSMEPTYKTGSVIYVKSVSPSELKADDVITFYTANGAVATHRVVELVEDGGITKYRTKGDANENVDGSLVAPEKVIGTPVFSIPYLGFVLSYIQSPPGLYVAIAVGAALLLFVFVPGLIFDNEKKPDKEEPVEGEAEADTAEEAEPVEEQPEEGNINQ